MNHRICAILGGMGPLSGADLSKKIVEEFGAERDQDHVPHLVIVDPTVPDRTTHLLEGGEDFVPAIVRQCQWAARCGADFVAIACNTAHAKIEEIRAGSPLPVLNMIEEAAKEAGKLAPGKRVGVIGTRGTLRLDLYGRELRKHGIEVVPTPEEAGNASHEAIYVTKTGDVGGGKRLALEAFDRMREEGAEAIVLGCTELPIVLDAALAEEPRPGVVIIDPTRVMARAIIRESGF